MINYTLRNKDELLEELRILGIKKKRLDDNYKLSIQDIAADINVIKAELELLKSIGKTP